MTKIAESQTKTTWQRMKLGDIADLNMGQSPKSEFYNDRGEGLPFFQGVTDFGERKPAETMYCSKPTKIVGHGDVLISVRAPVGDVNIAEKESCIGRGVAGIRAKDKNNEFVYYLLLNFKDYIRSYSGGTTYESINKDALRDLEFSVPESSVTRQQIADVLSTYDDLIENNTKRIKILEEIAQAIYRELASEEKGSVIKLENCFSIQRGKSYRSEELSNDEGVPFVNLKCIDRDGGFRKSGLKRFIGTYKESQKVIVGDIVIAVTDMTQDRRIVAHAARIPTLEGGFGVISMDLVKLQPKENCDPDYLYCLLRWSGFSDEVKNHANGANVLHLNPARITDYKTFVASPEKQKEFGDKVHSIFDLIDRLELQNESLRPARDLLLPKLVTGEIRV